MRFEKIDNKQFIILEDNDEIYIKPQNSIYDDNIKVVNTNNKLDIFAKKDIVNTIRGKDILNKVCVIPIKTKEEIIKLLDEWLDMFRKTYDIFDKLVKTEEYKRENIKVKLDFDINDKKYYSIKLCLSHMLSCIKIGSEIKVPKEDIMIYLYLISNVIEHYFKSFDGYQIEYLNALSDSDNIYVRNGNNEIINVLSNIKKLASSFIIEPVVTRLILDHNLNNSSSNLISNLKDKIENQQISEIYNKYIDYTKRQYEDIDNEYKEKQKVLKNTNN